MIKPLYLLLGDINLSLQTKANNIVHKKILMLTMIFGL